MKHVFTLESRVKGVLESREHVEVILGSAILLVDEGICGPGYDLLLEFHPATVALALISALKAGSRVLSPLNLCVERAAVASSKTLAPSLVE